MTTVADVKVSLIDPSPYQTRQKFDEESLQRLADDIKTNGLLNPPLCRPINGRYELMHGERRLRAAKLIPWDIIAVQVREATDLEARRICTAENVHRLDLTPIEVIEATVEWIDASLYDEAGYLEFGDTPQDRVRYLLVKLDSDRRHNTNYFAHKFMGKIEEAFKATNRDIDWRSFLDNDLRPYLNFDDDVKDVAVKHSLNKSQAKATQKLKEEAPEAFECVKETGALKIGLFDTEETPIEEASAREIGRAARTAKRETVKLQRQESPPLPSNKYRIVYADPPWCYGNSGLDDYGHAERHYPVMTIKELCKMGDRLRKIMDQDAVLFLWVTSPLLEECFAVIRAWGFKYKASFVWDKVGHNFGYYNSVRHEFLLVCTRGSCTPDVPRLFDSVQSIEKSRKHSEKPEQFREIIDTLYPHGKRIELFARTQVDNWDAWGNEPE